MRNTQSNCWCFEKLGRSFDATAMREHDDAIKWKHFRRYWPFVGGIHQSPVNSPQKGLWRGALMFSLFCARTNGWTNNLDACDLRRNRAHYNVTVMFKRGRRPFGVVIGGIEKLSLTSSSDDNAINLMTYPFQWFMLQWAKPWLPRIPWRNDKPCTI